jgi:actin cytoskeleton-regulatory complex protein PAN1
MAQWGQQGQPGYQYPMQTGFNPQQQPQFGGGLQPQPTGFPGQQRPGGFQQPQQTGFLGPGNSGFLQSQQTGFQPQQTGFGNAMGGGLGHRPAPAPPPVPPIPSQFQGQQSALSPMGRLAPQPTGFPGAGGGPLMSQPTGFPGVGGGGLMPQQTGFPGAGGMRGPSPAPLVPQMTGFVDPRLTMMSGAFMPANPSAPYAASGFAQTQMQQNPNMFNGMSLQQNFQQHNQEVRGSVAPKVPWALSKAEKKNYDQIFRAWDSANTGFIDGKIALEVFGASGLDRNDLARIW